MDSRPTQRHFSSSCQRCPPPEQRAARAASHLRLNAMNERLSVDMDRTRAPLIRVTVFGAVTDEVLEHYLADPNAVIAVANARVSSEMSSPNRPRHAKSSRAWNCQLTHRPLPKLARRTSIKSRSRPTGTNLQTLSTLVLTRSTLVLTRSTLVLTRSTPVLTRSTPVLTRSTPVLTRSTPH